MISVDEEYSVEITCTYKGETYRVRNNGAVYRVQKGKRKRQYDGFWTFGLKHIENGYMYIAQERVHRIVATAFHGEPKSKDLVVDHIDTNKANNRPENLRWVTRLENALSNPITRARIIYICGSIENFLRDPKVLYTTTVSDKNFGWMRTVSKDEARISKERLDEWARETPEELYKKIQRTGDGIDEWIFSPKAGNKHFSEDKEETEDPFIQPTINSLTPKNDAVQQKGDTKSSDDFTSHHNGNNITNGLDEHQYKPIITDSLTPNAKQVDWKTPTEFPFCPKNLSIEEYYNSITIGGVFSKSSLKEGVVVDKEWIHEGVDFVVLAKDENAFFPWMPTPVLLKDSSFLHFNCGTYHLESIARKEILKMKGAKVDYTEEEIMDMEIY